jgi:HK97 family phage major capsid protein
MLTREDIQSLIERFGGKAMAMRTMPTSYTSKDDSVEAVLTTEKPADVWDWEKWDVVPEVLRMDGMLLPEGRDQVPLLDTHSRYSISDQLGSVRTFGDANVAGYAAKIARFFFASTNDAQDAATKVKEGHVTDNSVGYEVLSSTWIAPGASVDVNGKTYNGGERGLRVTTQWKLKEVSLCPIGADELATIRSEAKKVAKREEMMDCPDCGMQTPADSTYCKSCGKEIKRSVAPDPIITITNNQGGITMPEPTKEQLTDQELQTIRENESKRLQGLNEWSQRFVGKIENIDDLKREAVTKGLSVDLFKGQLAEKMAEKGQPLVSPALGLSQAEIQRYSITKAIAYQCKQRGVAEFANEKIDATFELELSNEIAKQSGEVPKGLFVPYEKQPGRMAQRDQTVGSSTAGGNLVGTNLLASEYIDLPRNMYLADKIGVRMLGGLVGNVAIPKLTAAGTAEWVGESSAASETAVTVGQVTMAPKSVTAWYDYSRKLLLQSTPGIDAIINDDGDQILRLAIDKSIFHGTGTNQPTGLALTSGVGDVSAIDLTWAGCVEFRTDVASGNSLAGNMAFVTDPVTYGLLMTREKASGYPVYLLGDNGRIMNYPVYDSNQITAGYIFFGDGSKVLLGEWGTLDVLVDPYTASTKMDVRVVFFKSVDVGVRLASGWSIADDAS